MGKFPALLPGGLRYAQNHMWARPEGGRLRFGFTSYAVRLMQDVYFLDWQVSAGDRVELLQQIGHIETSKAVSDLFAPTAGVIVAFNPALLDDPSGINVDNQPGLGMFAAQRLHFDWVLADDPLLGIAASRWRYLLPNAPIVDMQGPQDISAQQVC